jgi:cell division cycle 2-like
VNKLGGHRRKDSDAYNSLIFGCRSVDEYIRLNFIDQGTYGMVFRARCRTTRRIYALKQVKIGKEASKIGFPMTALREANVLLTLRHPNIVRVREMVVGSTIDKIFMVMEFGGLDLKACMDIAKRPFSTAEVKQLMIQLLSAIDFMHQKWYIHRDLKTSNLLYQNGKLVVCDFGLARKYGSPIAPYTYEVVTLWCKLFVVCFMCALCLFYITIYKVLFALS